MKNVLAIHDLSCFGRCALTVVIPTLSAMSHQVTPLPTALLSTHTGGFENMTFTDLTDTMKPNFDHMIKSGAHFDAVYSGFLGSAAQTDTVSYIIKRCEDALTCVDPVMGDDGKLYQTYTEEMKERMCELCSLATVITPNLTEATFLLGESFHSLRDTVDEDAKNRSLRLCERLFEKYKCPHIAVTGIDCRSKNGDMLVGTAVLSLGKYSFIKNPHVGTGYPGTGDIFASVLLGELLKGHEFENCARKAANFISKLVLNTYAAQTPIRDGVLLEDNLSLLTRE